MNEEQQEIYEEGRRAYFDSVSDDISEFMNPYSGLDAEYWSDGYEDAKEDYEQEQRASNKE